MSKTLFVLLTVFILPATISAQPYVVVSDSVEGTVCGQVLDGYPVTHFVAIGNPDVI